MAFADDCYIIALYEKRRGDVEWWNFIALDIIISHKRNNSTK